MKAWGRNIQTQAQPRAEVMVVYAGWLFHSTTCYDGDGDGDSDGDGDNTK